MTRLANTFVVSGFWLATAAVSFSQDQLGGQPCPMVADDEMGCQLIAWSRLQEPRPLPDASSPPDRQPNEPQKRAELSRIQTLDGRVVSNEGRYSLQTTGGLALVLNNQEAGQQFEGKQVKINGRVDAKLKLLYIETIAPLAVTH